MLLFIFYTKLKIFYEETGIDVDGETVTGVVSESDHDIVIVLSFGGGEIDVDVVEETSGCASMISESSSLVGVFMIACAILISKRNKIKGVK